MSFRYHVVSLLAAFLALSVGIVVGSAALGPSTAAPVAAPSARPDDGFARAVGPRLVKGALSGQRVLVLLAPDAPPLDLTGDLTRAGATVTGQLRLTPALLDPTGAATVDDLLARVVPPGVSLPETSTLDRAATVLGAALTAQGPVLQEVYGGFAGAGLLAGPIPSTRATLVLVVAGPGRGAALATLATGFQRTAGVVVAGPASVVRGAVGVLRGQTGGASDVDNADTAQGRIAVVLALAEQAGGGAGHYGSVAGATAPVPDQG